MTTPETHAPLGILIGSRNRLRRQQVDARNLAGVMGLQLWQAVLLGAVQGASEFLPISSSGHLALVQHLMGLHGHLLTFDIGLHVGTLAAVVAAFGSDLAGIGRGVCLLKWSSPGMRLAAWIAVGTVPAALGGLLFADSVDATLGTPGMVAAFLLVTGVLLLMSRRWASGRRSFAELTWRDAAVIGVAQAFALFPGISRSGTTIVAGLSTGLAPQDAARYSFLLSIPTILGAALLQLRELGGTVLGLQTLAGALTAAAVGYVAVRWLLKLLGPGGEPRALGRFGFYTLALGAGWLLFVC